MQLWSYTLVPNLRLVLEKKKKNNVLFILESMLCDFTIDHITIKISEKTERRFGVILSQKLLEKSGHFKVALK